MANTTAGTVTAPGVRRAQGSNVDRNASTSTSSGHSGEAGPSPRAVSSRSAWPTVEESVARSTDIWARDLRAAYEHAKDRFADVCWEAERDAGGIGHARGLAERCGQDKRIWGHKAIIYARAPRDFKDRYFARRQPASGVSPRNGSTPLPDAVPQSFDPRYAFSPKSAAKQENSSVSRDPSSLSPMPPRAGPGTDGVMRLTHGDTPEMFAAQLEWLYTGEGFGDVVEWISNDDLPALNASTGSRKRDSLGRRGNQADRREKLGQDLAYMWRSKLYADIRIHLDDALEQMDGGEGQMDGNESDTSARSWSAASVFPAHRFILVSRSPYFASVLLNASNFRSQTGDVHLPMPPFTPAALHFCLGYIYAGHLDFSNRSFDLPTACQIYRAATYLQIEPLQEEIVSRLVHDFCHGLDSGKCRCGRCPLRAAAVWRFALASDIGHTALAKSAKSLVTRRWGDALGREVGLADEKDRAGLLIDIIENINANNVVAAFKHVSAVRTRIATGVRARGRDAGEWVEPLEDMVDKLEDHARKVLLDDFSRVAESRDLWDLLLGKGFSYDLLERVFSELVDVVGRGTAYLEAPAVYQTLVSSILLKPDTTTMQTILSPRSTGRHPVESARQSLLGHIRRRWLPIRDAGRFDGLENWCLKEISDEIEVPVEELLSATEDGPVPRKAQAAAIKFPRTSSRVTGLADAATPDKASVRSRGFMRASASPAQRSPAGVASPSGPSTTPRSAGEPSGLRRLRLSSSIGSNATFARIRPDQRVLLPPHKSEGQPLETPKPVRATARSATSARAATPPSTQRTGSPALGTPKSRKGDRLVSGAVSSSPLSRPGAATQDLSPAHRAQNATAGPSRLPTTGHPTVQVSTSPRSGLSRPSTPRHVQESGKEATLSASSPSASTVSARTTATIRSVATAKTAGATAKAIGKQPIEGSPSITSLRSTNSPTNSARSSSTAARAPPGAAVSLTSASPVPRTANPPVRLPLRRPPLSDTSRQNGSPGQTGRAASTSLAASSARNVSTGTAMSVRSRVTALESAAANDNRLGPETGRRPLAMKPHSASPRPPGQATAAGGGVAAQTAASAARALRSPGAPSAIAPKSPAKSTVSVRSTRTVAAPRTAVAALQSAASTKSSAARSNLSTSASRNTLRPSPSISSIKRTRPSAPPTNSVDREASAPQPMSQASKGSPLPKEGPSSRASSSVPTVRSPSSSTTDEPGAVTPHLPQSSFPEPILVVQRDYLPGASSTPPGSAPPAFDSSKLALPLALPIPPRPVRKVSTASILSMASSATGSIGRFHPASAFDPPPRARSPPLLAKQQVPEGMRAFDDAGVKGVSIRVGIPCIVSLKHRRARFKANVRYIGHLQGARGVWVGIEVDDLSARFGITTVPSGSRGEIHYFHVGSAGRARPSPYELDRMTARRRQIERIRDSLAQERRERYASAGGTSFGLGLGLPSPVALGFDRDLGVQKSTNPVQADRETGFEHPRALFVRPSEVVFVIGAE